MRNRAVSAHIFQENKIALRCFGALAASLALFACGSSEKAASAECSGDEAKADCIAGKYSKCIDGKWSEAVCEGGASCRTDGTCGECKDGDSAQCQNDEDGAGNVLICHDGQWSEAVCEGGASCRTDGTCGECKDGDSTQCQNDEDDVGNALICRNGEWSDALEMCPGMPSCAMSSGCYDCFRQCDFDWACNAACADSSCQSTCNKNAVCKKECGSCDSWCGECRNKNNKNCTEDAAGIGSADICLNGTWGRRNCNNVSYSGIEVSCMRVCPTGGICGEEEKEDRCGMCKNTLYVCVRDDGLYWPIGSSTYPVQMGECSKGLLNITVACTSGICDSSTGQCD